MINPKPSDEPISQVDVMEVEDKPIMVAGTGSKLLRELLKSKKLIKKSDKTPPAAPEPPPPPEAKSEAERIMSLRLEDYDPEDIHQPNFDRITTTDEVKATIGDMSEQYKGKIMESRRGIITDQQLNALSEDLGVRKEAVQQVMERESGGTMNAENILAARKMLNDSAGRITTLAKKIKVGEATDQEKVQFMRQIQFHQDYQAQFMGMRAEAGRALRAFNIPAGESELSMAKMRELIDVTSGKSVDKMAEVLADAQSIGEVNKLVKLNWRQKTSGVLYEVYLNGILSGVKTHIVNTSGNALFQGMNIAETAVAAQIGRFLPGKDHVMLGEAKSYLYGALGSWQDAMGYAWRAFKAGESGGLGKMETFHRKYIDSQSLEISGPAGRVVDFIGSVVRIPTERLLTAEDEFFKTAARRGALRQMAHREAMKRQAAENLTDIEADKLIREFMDNPPESALAAMEDTATKMTFQQPLGKNGRYIQSLIANTPGMKWLAPFVRTPVNLFKAGLLERSPLAVFNSEFHAEIAAGGARRDMALAKVSMGTLTTLAAAMAADSGTITGGGPSNPKARKVLEATGWKPYSIRVEDPLTGEVTYQSYARAEPMAYIIGATADAVELAKYTDTEEDTAYENILAAIIGGVANNTMSKTFLSGLSDFNQVLTDPHRYAKYWTERMMGSMLPYSSFRRDLSKIQDPIIRDAWELKEKLKISGGVPGWSEDAPPSLNIFGEARYHANSDILGVLSPFPEAKLVDDPVKLEIANLMEETKQVPLTMPGKRIEGMKLSADEYYDYVNKSRQEIKLGGMDFQAALRKIMNSTLYLSATPDTQVTLIKDIQHRFDDAARAEMLRTNTELRNRVLRHRAEQARKKYGEDNLPQDVKNLLQ